MQKWKIDGRIRESIAIFRGRFELPASEKSFFLAVFTGQRKIFAFQGFHLLCDIHDGMAGISSEIAQYIYDEYPRNVIMAVPIFPSDLALEVSA